MVSIKCHSAARSTVQLHRVSACNAVIEQNMSHDSGNEHFSVSQDGGKPVQRIPEPWARLIRFCQELGHGEIERLKIQDGVPVIADVVREKVKFT